MGVPLILVADDKGYLREFLATVLRVRGYEVEVAANGWEVLERARAKKPDLILLDLLMPGMDGREVARAMQGDPELRDIPIVMITAWAEAGDEPLPPGVKGLLVKPFGLDALYAMVGRYVSAPLPAAETGA